ncbi:IclR family transcriptional regulator [soil metagenome]
MNAMADVIDHEASRDQPLDRALAVLDAVSATTRAISVTDIAADCSLPVPTVHRLVAQLERRGLLKRVIGSRKLIVGPGLVKLGVAALQSSMRSDRAHQILVSFANRIGEHCQIARRANDDMLMYLDTARALRSTGLHFEQSRRTPLHCTSIGKLYLAEMPDDEFDDWLAANPLESLAPRTITRASDMRAAVRKVRKEGWATNHEELAIGVIGCAVPIRDFDGRLMAGLGISVPSVRMTMNQLHEFRASMEAAAADIAAAVLAEH